jgi:uncharacterized protein YndB with AHSA1/START domain
VHIRGPGGAADPVAPNRLSERRRPGLGEAEVADDQLAALAGDHCDPLADQRGSGADFATGKLVHGDCFCGGSPAPAREAIARVGGGEERRIAPAMGPVSAQIDVDAPRPLVFDFIADLRNRPAFMDHFMDGFHLLRIDSVGVGAGARFRFTVAPQATWVETAVEEMSRPHRISERGRAGREGRIPCAIEWETTDGPGSLTRVRVAHWTRPTHPLDRAKDVLGGASVWYERNWRTALRRLRDLLESGAPAAPQPRVAGGNRYATGVP